MNDSGSNFRKGKSTSFEATSLGTEQAVTKVMGFFTKVVLLSSMQIQWTLTVADLSVMKPALVMEFILG